MGHHHGFASGSLCLASHLTAPHPAPPGEMGQSGAAGTDVGASALGSEALGARERPVGVWHGQIPSQRPRWRGEAQDQGHSPSHPSSWWPGRGASFSESRQGSHLSGEGDATLAHPDSPDPTLTVKQASPRAKNVCPGPALTLGTQGPPHGSQWPASSRQGKDFPAVG